jgi:hypothetical protein
MSGDIVLSSALRNNLLSLQNTQRNIDTAQLRLATGLKVNSALDNPQNFFTAKALNNRASDLTRLLDGISQSIRTIEQANTGVETLQNLLDQADAIALDAQSEIRASEGYSRVRGNVDLSDISNLVDIGGGGVINDGDTFEVTVYDEDGAAVTGAPFAVTIDDGETVDNIVAELNSNADFSEVAKARVTNSGYLEISSKEENYSIRISSGGTGQPLDNAGFAALGLDTIVGVEDDAAGGTQQGGIAIAGNTLKSTIAANQAPSGEYEASQQLGSDTVGPDSFGAEYIGDGETVDFRLNIDGEAVDIGTFTSTDTIQNIIDGINNAGRTDVEASFNTTTGRIEIAFDDTVGQVELEFESAAGANPAFGFGGTAIDVAVGAGNVASANFTFDGVNPDVDQYEEDFNNIREQIDQLVQDSNYRGVNLLSGDNLETYFNEDRSNKLRTEGVDFTSLGLGIQEGDFTNAANVQMSIDALREATNSVRNFGQSIANDLSVVQFRRDFTEQTINTLQSGADDLTVADQNEEGANLLALQTRQALGTTSLSLAAQSQQSVLRLF